jgi:single-strand DNA-binding protein
MSINVVHLVGRVGVEPEIKWFEGSGKCVCTVVIAVNRRSKNPDTKPDWFNLKIWGKTGEIAKNYATKGSLIGVKGSLEIETWIDRATGTERSRPVIKVDSLDLLSSKKDSAEAMPDYG